MNNKLFKIVAGIDISKKTFDLSLGFPHSKKPTEKTSFPNHLKGFDQLASWIKKRGVSFDQILFCMESTGIYHRLLCSYLLSKNAFIWVETPVKIKWSMGLQRGKTDPADAFRIMQYATRHQDKAIAYEEKDRTLQQVADYLTLRGRLSQCLHALKVPIKELKAAGLVEESKAISEASSQSIIAIKAELKALEKKIKELIQADPKLAKLYELITSVRCVGFVAASHLLVYTQAFTRFNSAKQLASFAGVAPFPYSSGTSVKGRTKVHPMANRKLKTVLHLCAISSVKNNPELKEYYDRKVKEGKNKMSVINAIRNKILQRIFACVKNQRMYTAELSR